ncbi:hypothetical protein LTR12_007057 [Friedmanniomyces endolithicus]|nr:hypothetical protein LTR74_008660 [Friedmanniomyces endolithicus]KAK1818498.1 hypothetical protein LTR12_007057 [Friedmanniomyces endolithicus]
MKHTYASLALVGNTIAQSTTFACNPAHSYPNGASCISTAGSLTLVTPSASAPTTTFACNPAHSYPNGASCISTAGGLTLATPSVSASTTFACNPAHSYPNGASCVSTAGSLTLVTLPQWSELHIDCWLLDARHAQLVQVRPYQDSHSLCECDKYEAVLHVDIIAHYVHAGCPHYAVVKQLEALLDLEIYEAILHDDSSHRFDHVLPDAHVVDRQQPNDHRFNSNHPHHHELPPWMHDYQADQLQVPEHKALQVAPQDQTVCLHYALQLKTHPSP